MVGVPIPWQELASMLVVITGLFSGINWLMLKGVVMPAVAEAIKEFRLWTEKSYPTVAEFRAHLEIDENNQAALQRELAEIRRWMQELNSRKS